MLPDVSGMVAHGLMWMRRRTLERTAVATSPSTRLIPCLTGLPGACFHAFGTAGCLEPLATGCAPLDVQARLAEIRSQPDPSDPLN